jgi:hypothetical protein
MSLRSLMESLKNRAVDTPDTSQKNTGYQLKPSIHAGCTPDTSVTPEFVDTPVAAPIEVVNWVFVPMDPEPDPVPPTDPSAWHELAAAYNVHHFKCSTCIAAGYGAKYGLRCGTGAALWTTYQNT